MSSKSEGRFYKSGQVAVDYGELTSASMVETATKRDRRNAQKAVYRAEQRLRARLAVRRDGAPAPTGQRVGAPPSVWTPAMLDRLRVLIDAGHKPGAVFRAKEFPGLTYMSIKGKIDTLQLSAYRGGHQGLGLHIGFSGPPPDPARLAERDARLEAESAIFFESPNRALLGDPSPQRLAVARALDRHRVASQGSWETHEPAAPVPFSMSAVPVTGPRNQVKNHHAY